MTRKRRTAIAETLSSLGFLTALFGVLFLVSRIAFSFVRNGNILSVKEILLAAGFLIVLPTCVILIAGFYLRRKG